MIKIKPELFSDEFNELVSSLNRKLNDDISSSLYNNPILSSVSSVLNTINKFVNSDTLIENFFHKDDSTNLTNSIAEDAEDYGIEYILNHYDKQSIEDIGDGIYQKVSEKIYEYIKSVIYDMYKDSLYDVDSICDEISDIVYERVNLNRVWESIDHILDAPVTIEDKLNEVGMSSADFL